MRFRRNPIEDVRKPLAGGSLRARVVVSTLALLFVVLVSLGLIVDAILSDRLHSDLHQQLNERAKFAVVLAGRGLTGQQLADALTGSGITGSVQAGGQTYVGRDQPHLPGPGGQNGPGPGGHVTGGQTPAPVVTITQRGPQLFARVDVGSAALLLTTSAAEIDHTLSILRTTELAAGAATLLLAGLLSFSVVGGALAPLRRMSALADRIRGGDRGLRLRPVRADTDLGRTATALDAMLDSLEAAEADAQSGEIRMRRFLADASHDLRTPLAVMSAHAEQLLHKDPGRYERERQLVELIRESRRAARLVDDLLLMARLDDLDPSTALMHDELDLGLLVTAAVNRVRPLIRDRRLELHLPAGPVLVRGDADRLTRVLLNLLDNAREATAPGGSIRVDVVLLPAAGFTSVAVVDVRDDGRGIAASDHDRVFDRFVRVDETRHRGGSGLGLPIARAIARGHHGELRIVAAVGGAHFRLELPAREPASLPGEGGGHGRAEIEDSIGVAARR